jgi:hypothetical protein
MVETVRGEVQLAGEAVELYFHVGLDYVWVEGDGEHGDVGDNLPCVPGHLLVLVLFLQGKEEVEGGGGEEGEEGRGKEREKEKEAKGKGKERGRKGAGEPFVFRKEALGILGF